MITFSTGEGGKVRTGRSREGSPLCPTNLQQLPSVRCRRSFVPSLGTSHVLFLRLLLATD